MTYCVLWMVVLAVAVINDVQGNEAPKVQLTKANVDVSENAPAGTTLAQALVTDTDSGADGEFTCSMESNNMELELAGSTGQYSIKVKQPYNFEDGPDEVLKVECIDKGTPPLTGHASMTVNIKDVNEAPTFIDPLADNKEFDIYMGTDLNEQPIMVKATDPDAGVNGQVEYSFKTAETMFNIETTNDKEGSITAKKSPAEGEAKEYTVTVKASDKGTPPLSAERILKVKFKEGEAPNGQVSFNNLFANLLLVSIVNILYFML